jgi:hypothetical protein
MNEEKLSKPNTLGELTDSPKFQEKLSKKNTLGDMLNSPEMIKMQEDLADAHKKSVDSSVGWYYNLSSEDKYKAVEALCHIICKAEHQGTSHRGLMDTLGIYPEAFFIDSLLDLHNSMWTYYHDKKRENEIEEDVKTFKNFMDNAQTK